MFLGYENSEPLLKYKKDSYPSKFCIISSIVLLREALLALYASVFNVAPVIPSFIWFEADCISPTL